MIISKVLIAEDHQILNISVQKTLEELGITNIEQVYYCDDALERIEKANKTGQPYDLLITDLHFEPDARKQNLSGGTDLIEAVRKIQPDLNILVFSAVNKAHIIKYLYNELNIDGYVFKARNDTRELKQAIDEISRHRRYYTRQIMQLINNENAYELSPLDITIITLLAQGILQKDIPHFLQQQQIKPFSLSTVEKRLNQMKDALNFTKNEQLVAFCKDKGLI